MNHYLDITLLPDAEIPSTVLMNAICAKLHKMLFDLHSKDIGISFPKYQITLGNVLRLHGKEAELNKLKSLDWLGGMKGYCKINDVFSIPANAKYRIISRKQPNMSEAKLNRLLKRGSITVLQAESYRNKMFSKRLANPPYLDLVSGSTGQRHRRYIELGELLEKPIVGEFDQFGLSKTATVPWF